jgi:ABC-type proline/glycine betaine transport system substrate-binding protein
LPRRGRRHETGQRAPRCSRPGPPGTPVFFQEALVRKGLEELGYKVKAPKDLQNPIFYKSVALGDVDYWTNGWFPNHNSQLAQKFL